MQIELEDNINDVLIDFGIPEFTVRSSIESLDDMVKRITKGYQNEVRIQAIWGGIRNPAAVLHNKIRHELTNYDDVRGALTEATENGLDITLAVDIREELVNMSYQMCAAIIDRLPHTITVKDSRGYIAISQNQLHKANDGYWQKETKQVFLDKTKIYS